MLDARQDRPGIPASARRAETLKEHDHETALCRIDELMDAEPGTTNNVVKFTKPNRTTADMLRMMAVEL